ncbi:DUF418 domain-containing protein [Streptomyces sp. NPDC127051]
MYPGFVLGRYGIAPLIAASRLWLRRFERGPLEAVQHWALSSLGPRRPRP